VLDCANIIDQRTVGAGRPVSSANGATENAGVENWGVENDKTWHEIARAMTETKVAIKRINQSRPPESVHVPWPPAARYLWPNERPGGLNIRRPTKKANMLNDKRIKAGWLKMTDMKLEDKIYIVWK